MRGRQRLLWICTGLYTVLGGKNKGSVTSRVCVFPLWYSTIFPFYTKLLSYTSTQFFKIFDRSSSLSMTLFLNWQLCVLCSYRFVYWWVFFVSLKPFPLFPFSWICRPYLSFQLSDVSGEYPLWYSRDYILMIWLSCVRISPAKVFSSSLPKVV